MASKSASCVTTSMSLAAATAAIHRSLTFADRVLSGATNLAVMELAGWRPV